MNLHHLEIFHTLAATGSVSACAARMHVSQPAVSRQLKEFENRLGVVLFERMPRGVRLTQAGEVLRDYASRLFEIAHTAQAAVKALADAEQGQLAIGASNTIGTYILPRLIALFRKRHPNIQISMFVGNTEQVSQGVADMRFVLGFIEGPLHVADLQIERFREDEIVPVVFPEHPLTRKLRPVAADFSGQPLLMREPGSGTRELIEAALRQQGVRPGGVVEFGNAEAIKQAAIHGGGIAFLPRVSIPRELEAGDLVVLPARELTIRRSLSVIHRATGHVTPLATAFLTLLKTRNG
ncbi:MAG TPA: LysR family transcriptional regulator [Steroidobacteraceae bacterium]|nr:LysR family transcriptional regulator [Steroidobacteraceae bacterium]